MTLSDFRSRVARVSGMSTSDATDLALIDSWANEAVVQFLRDTKINVQKASLAVTAGSSDYHLDDDILSFTDAWWEPAANSERSPLLEQVDSAEIIRMREYAEPTGYTTCYYALEGWNLLQLYPAPAEGDLLHIKYVPRPTNSMTAAAHSPSADTYGNIPPEFHTLLEAYAKWKACEAEEHKPSDNGLRFQAEYERGVSKVKADLTRKAGVMKARSRWGTRRRFPAPTPGTDLGPYS